MTTTCNNTSDHQKPLWVITGASSGVGKELALQAGTFANVVAIGRQSTGLETVTQAGCRSIVLDLASEHDWNHNSLQAMLEEIGPIDVLINAAGYLLEGAVEETSHDELQHVFAAHLFGPLRLMRAILPLMRERHQGIIANVAGIGALRGATNAGAYCASKAALTTLTESLQQELAPLGIQVCLIQLGHFRTSFLQPGHRRNVRKHIDDYDPVLEPVRAAFNAFDGVQQGSPPRAAQAIVEVLRRREIPPLLSVGPDVPPAELAAHDERRKWMLGSSDLTGKTDI